MEVLKQYEQYLEMYYSSYTKETYLEQIKMFFNFLKEYKGKLNHIIIYNIDKKDVYNYLAFISKYEKGTRKVKISAIKNFYSFINKNRADFLFDDIKLYGNNSKLPYYLTKSEIRALMNFYDGEKADIIFLFLNLGIRLNEMANLDFKKVNFEEKYLIITQKGGYQRKVFFNDTIKRNFAKI